MKPYFGIHNHTAKGSNIRLIDSINKPEILIKKAKELGLSGIAFTEHESLTNHVEINKIMTEMKDDDFTIALGNEIYLINERGPGQKYYHFLLIAKDAIGHKALRELSSTAWYHMYSERGQDRVPTLKSELAEIVNKYKGHLIATTACIGGELSSNVLLYSRAKAVEDYETATKYYNSIYDFVQFCKDLFGEDFYIECAPSDKEDQMTVNKGLYGVAKFFNVKMVVGTDSHYPTINEREIHKAYLNSKEEEREVDDFYEFARLMDSDEVEKLLSPCFPEGFVNEILNNTLEIQNKIKYYSLFHKQDIPSVEVKDYPKHIEEETSTVGKHEHLRNMLNDDDVQNRYWVNECLNKLYQLANEKEDIGLNIDSYLDELEEEARVKSVISEKLETNMFRYPNTLQHYIDLIWDCGSIVGAGRGSSCAALNHYLMGITQLDPIEWNLPFFRYLNDERVELGDIDIDICPSKRPIILDKIREERAHMLTNTDGCLSWAKEALGCTLVATFGTEKTKSAIQTACRGYRSEEYPEGIDVDEAQYMSSLIPQERGFLWTIDDVVYGNEDLGRKKIPDFIREVNKYPGLLDIIQGIDGMINHRGSHASGVILFNDDPFEHCAFMRTPSGDITTQFDLHDAEYMGNTKYDFLVTEVQDKIVQCIKLLQEDNQIEKDLSLRKIYDKYFHPNVLPLEDNRIWDALANNEVLNCFQFDSAVGAQAAKMIKPHNMWEISDANGLMRLMGEDGEERPLEKYVKFKQNIDLWYKEMTNFGLTKEEQGYLEPHFKSSYGVPPSQEQLMRMLMDKNICGFTLGEANAARKIVGKKQMSKIPSLKEKVLKQAKSEKLGQYVWKYGAGPQMGYSFSVIHALAYSFIGVQTLYLATNWNPIYWNTACLIVNSGSLEDNSEEEIVDIFAPEGDDLTNGVTFEDLPDRKTKIRKTSSTNYEKIAKAMGDIINAGIKIGPVDINKTDFGFKPDVENNQILYGMKSMLNVSDDTVREIIANRPYVSPQDFLNKVKVKKSAMISLIKGGAFDSMMDRKLCMGWYLWQVCDKKQRLTLQNMPGLMRYNIIPDTPQLTVAKKVFEFNRYLKSCCKVKDSSDYLLDERAIDFLNEIEADYLLNIQNGNYYLNPAQWDKKGYQPWMDVVRAWLNKNKDEALQQLNEKIFKETWDTYASGTISSWEMEVLCFYFHDHELKNVNKTLYGLVDFSALPEEPVVDEVKQYGSKEIKYFKLDKICGTCIAKNKVKSTVTLLTTSGVVDVKFRKEYFTLFDKRISEKGDDGAKHIIENSWFNRGSMIVVTGMRSGDNFIVKKYNSTPGHQLYKIEELNNDGTFTLRSERYKGEMLDE